MSIVVNRRCEETSWRRNVDGIGEYVPVCKDDQKRNVKPFERAVDEVVAYLEISIPEMLCASLVGEEGVDNGARRASADAELVG
jgi:hypothetical protein